MNYESMTDFEINKAICMAEGISIDGEQYEGLCDRDERIVLCESALWVSMGVDYCNNPSDAWPIIDSIWSKLNSNMPRSYTSLWQHQIDLNGGNKLRAAMIIYLEMNKDKE